MKYNKFKLYVRNYINYPFYIFIHNNTILLSIKYASCSLMRYYNYDNFRQYYKFDVNRAKKALIYLNNIINLHQNEKHDDINVDIYVLEKYIKLTELCYFYRTNFNEYVNNVIYVLKHIFINDIVMIIMLFLCYDNSSENIKFILSYNYCIYDIENELNVVQYLNLHSN